MESSQVCTRFESGRLVSDYDTSPAVSHNRNVPMYGVCQGTEENLLHMQNLPIYLYSSGFIHYNVLKSMTKELQQPLKFPELNTVYPLISWMDLHTSFLLTHTVGVSNTISCRIEIKTVQTSLHTVFNGHGQVRHMECVQLCAESSLYSFFRSSLLNRT